MSTQMVNLYDALSETFGKDRAHLAIKDIEDYLSDHKRELATKHDLTETELRLTREIEQIWGEMKGVELRLTKEIEQAKSSTIKWVVGLLMAQTGLIFTMITLWK